MLKTFTNCLKTKFLLTVFFGIILAPLLDAQSTGIQEQIKQGVKEAQWQDEDEVSILKRDYHCKHTQKGGISCDVKEEGASSGYPGKFNLIFATSKDNVKKAFKFHKGATTSMEVKKKYTNLLEYPCTNGAILRIRGNESYLLVKATSDYTLTLLDNNKNDEQISASAEKILFKNMCETDYSFYLNNRGTFKGIAVPQLDTSIETKENIEGEINPNQKEIELDHIKFFSQKDEHGILRFMNADKNKELRVSFNNKDKTNFLQLLQGNFDMVPHNTFLCENNVTIFETATDGLYQAFILLPQGTVVLAEKYNPNEEISFNIYKDLQLCKINLTSIQN